MNRELFLDSIKPGVRIDYDFCMKIYGYDISSPGFADQVLNKIEALGLKEIRRFYHSSVKKYEDKYNDSMKKVSEWYSKKCQDEWERKVKKNESRSDTVCAGGM